MTVWTTSEQHENNEVASERLGSASCVPGGPQFERDGASFDLPSISEQWLLQPQLPPLPASELVCTGCHFRHLAHHDSLTNLPNRTLLKERLQRALTRAKRDGTLMALMFLDLNKFKPVNDTFGHRIGDLLLKNVAIRLQNSVRESDTAARVGGDEFNVLLEAIGSAEDALAVAIKIKDELENKPVEIAGRTFHISSSIGIAVYPAHGRNESELMHKADSAMYRAKQLGGSAIQLFSHERLESQVRTPLLHEGC